MSEHTPGPWRVENATTGSKFSEDWREILSSNRAIVTPDSYESSRYGGETICGVYISAANARLIAAAPDLLNMLQQAVGRIELVNKEGNPILSAWLPIAKKIIAKATGEDA